MLKCSEWRKNQQCHYLKSVSLLAVRRHTAASYDSYRKCTECVSLRSLFSVACVGLMIMTSWCSRYWCCTDTNQSRRLEDEAVDQSNSLHRASRNGGEKNYREGWATRCDIDARLMGGGVCCSDDWRGIDKRRESNASSASNRRKTALNSGTRDCSKTCTAINQGFLISVFIRCGVHRLKYGCK